MVSQKIFGCVPLVRPYSVHGFVEKKGVHKLVACLTLGVRVELAAVGLEACAFPLPEVTENF